MAAQPLRSSFISTGFLGAQVLRDAGVIDAFVRWDGSEELNDSFLTSERSTTLHNEKPAKTWHYPRFSSLVSTIFDFSRTPNWTKLAKISSPQAVVWKQSTFTMPKRTSRA